MTEAAETIGHRLRSQRQGAGYTQDELGRRLGYSKAHISKVERGARLPSASLIEEWQKVCGFEQDFGGLNLNALPPADRRILEDSATLLASGDPVVRGMMLDFVVLMRRALRRNDTPLDSRSTRHNVKEV